MSKIKAMGRQARRPDKITFEINLKLANRVRERAEAEGVSMSEMIQVLAADKMAEEREARGGS